MRGTDLRAGAALTLAGLAAHGQTEIGELHHIDRGYDRLVEKLPCAAELVRKAVQQKLGMFTKQDIRELCPLLSVSSIEGALRKLIDEGDIKREGVGRATKYIRLK